MIMDAKRALEATRKALFIVAGFSLMINLLMLTSPIYMMQIYNRVMNSSSKETLVMLTLLALFCLIIMSMLEQVRSSILIHVSNWLDRVMGKNLVTTSIQASALTRQVNDIQGLRDLTTIRNFVSGSTIFSFFDVPFMPFYMAVIFLIHPALGYMSVLGAIVLFGLAILNEYATRAPLNAASKIQLKQMEYADAAVRNAEVVESMGMLPAIVRRWSKENDTVMALQTLASRRASGVSSVTKFFRQALQTMIMAVGMYYVLNKEMSSGGMIAASMILGRALAPVEQMIGTWKMFLNFRQSYARINQLMNRSQVLARGTMTYPDPEGRLQVEGAHYVPPGSNRPILRNVSFALEPGESVGVIGPSAAGKSTLARLLVGVWPCAAGKVRLDGIDVYTWDRTDFGRHVGYLPQDVELFAGTVKENIARLGEISDEDIVAAAQAANAHDLILRLPQGYDTPIGHGGASLSGGQRQRIGLARALLGSPRLLVLDEPNSNLDTEGEGALLEALKAAKARGTTIVIIAHRPSVLAFVDKMLVLRDGQVEQFGDKNQVMARLTKPQGPPAGPRPTLLKPAGATAAAPAPGDAPQAPAPAAPAGE